MEPEVAGALAGAAAGGLMASVTRFILDRRREHAEARSIARLLYRELEEVHICLTRAIEDRRPWDGDDFDIPTWREHGYRIAGELDDGEVLALSVAPRWMATANGVRASRIRRQTPLRFMNREIEFSADDLQALVVAAGAIDIARQSIAPLRKGRRLFMFRRRVPLARAPSLATPCSCGHAFGEHHWRTKRRLLRLRSLRASHQDVASACSQCACERFLYADPSKAKLFLRRRRLLPQAPFD